MADRDAVRLARPAGFWHYADGSWTHVPVPALSGWDIVVQLARAPSTKSVWAADSALRSGSGAAPRGPGPGSSWAPANADRRRGQPWLTADWGGEGTGEAALEVAGAGAATGGHAAGLGTGTAVLGTGTGVLGTGTGVLTFVRLGTGTGAMAVGGLATGTAGHEPAWLGTGAGAGAPVGLAMGAGPVAGAELGTGAGTRVCEAAATGRGG